MHGHVMVHLKYSKVFAAFGAVFFFSIIYFFPISSSSSSFECSALFFLALGLLRSCTLELSFILLAVVSVFTMTTVAEGEERKIEWGKERERKRQHWTIEKQKRKSRKIALASVIENICGMSLKVEKCGMDIQHF